MEQTTELVQMMYKCVGRQKCILIEIINSYKIVEARTANI